MHTNAEAIPESAASNDSTGIQEPQLHRVLVVEDDADTLASFMMLLTLYGLDVRGAGDATTALAVTKEFLPTIAFIDIDLPGMNGYDLARTLRQQYNWQMRLCATTGFTTPRDKLRALGAGFNCHLSKPLDLRAVRTLLGLPNFS